jgi:hypothetical protein
MLPLFLYPAFSRGRHRSGRLSTATKALTRARCPRHAETRSRHLWVTIVVLRRRGHARAAAAQARPEGVVIVDSEQTSSLSGHDSRYDPEKKPPRRRAVGLRRGPPPTLSRTISPTAYACATSGEYLRHFFRATCDCSSGERAGRSPMRCNEQGPRLFLLAGVLQQRGVRQGVAVAHAAVRRMGRGAAEAGPGPPT